MRRVAIPFLIVLCLLTPGRSAAQDASAQKVDTLRPSYIRAQRARGLLIQEIRPVEMTALTPAGVPDVVKTIQTFPGVSTGVEGGSAFYVRGGNFGNNQFTLDGTTLYGTSHLLGLTTVFPAEVLEETSFKTGGFSASESNFTASQVRMRSCDGSMAGPHADLSASTAMFGGSFSTPLVKDKASLLVSARYAPFAWEYNKIRPFFSEGVWAPDSLKTLVTDVFGKLTVKAGSRGVLRVSGFYSMDAYRFSLSETSTDLIRWRNLVGQASYETAVGERSSFSAQVSYNDYNSLQAIVRNLNDPTTLQLFSAIGEWHAFAQMEYVFLAGHSLTWGADARFARFRPGSYRATGNKSGEYSVDNTADAHIYALYGDYAFSGIENFDCRVGLRLNLYSGQDLWRLDPEVRVMVQYAIRPDLNIQLSYDETVQYYHTLEGIPTGWSLDIKIPSDGRNLPEKASQFYVGIDWKSGCFSLATGGYWKYMRNLVYFPDAVTLFNPSLSGWKSRTEIGNGHSYGWEILAAWRGERLEAKLSYTLSKTDRVFPNLNESKPFPAQFDRRHILSADGRWIVGRQGRIEHGATTLVSFSTGHWESLRSGTYPAFMPGMTPNDELYPLFASRDYYSHPNNYRMPYYFRWDIGYFLNVSGASVSHKLQAGIYNLTNRHNASTLYYDEQTRAWKKLSIFPLMPTLYYSVSF